MLNIPAHKNCVNCGDCCGIVPADIKEVHTIRYFLKVNPAARERVLKQSVEAFDCLFRDNKAKRCLIYPARPVVCRLMGVTRGMNCTHGNSANINGIPFIAGHDQANEKILNFVDWE